MDTPGQVLRGWCEGFLEDVDKLISEYPFHLELEAMICVFYIPTLPPHSVPVSKKPKTLLSEVTSNVGPCFKQPPLFQKTLLR